MLCMLDVVREKYREDLIFDSEDEIRISLYQDNFVEVIRYVSDYDFYNYFVVILYRDNYVFEAWNDLREDELMIVIDSAFDRYRFV